MAVALTLRRKVGLPELVPNGMTFIGFYNSIPREARRRRTSLLSSADGCATLRRVNPCFCEGIERAKQGSCALRQPHDRVSQKQAPLPPQAGALSTSRIGNRFEPDGWFMTANFSKGR